MRSKLKINSRFSLPFGKWTVLSSRETHGWFVSIFHDLKIKIDVLLNIYRMFNVVHYVIVVELKGIIDMHNAMLKRAFVFSLTY